MVLVGNAALVALLISTLLLFTLLFINVKVKKKKQIHWCFIAIIICLLICCIGQMLSIIIPRFYDIEPIYFDYFVYIGTCFLPIAFLAFGLTFAKTKITFTKKYLLLFIIPILTLLILWTNDFHHLFYIKYAVLNSETVFGPYFPIHSLYTYALIFVGVFYLIRYSIKNTGFFSKQSVLLILGVIFPLAINIVGLFGIEMSIYVTPISLTTTVLFFSIAILKFNFLNVTPIALQTVVDRMSDGYIVLDENNTIIDFNKTFLNMVRLSDTKLRGKEFFSMFGKNTNFKIDNNLFKEYIKKSKTTNKTFSIQLEVINVDKYFNIEISGIESHGSILGTLILFKDISQHVHDLKIINDNQETLMERERLASLGQLIGGIAHNLKTPIMSISGAAEGLHDLVSEYDASIEDPRVTYQDHHDIAKDMLSWIEKIKTHTEYMSDIITAVKGQAVTLSETDSVHFTLDELVKRVDILMKHELKNAIIYLNILMKTDEHTVINGDINSLVQVINNMISNAIQAYNGQKNKNIELILETKEEHVLIHVKDYASGMPKKVQDKLFKEMITTKGKNGTGLGLYMSYSTIKAHFNGDITFESEEGKGTTFTIILPL